MLLLMQCAPAAQLPHQAPHLRVLSAPAEGVDVEAVPGCVDPIATSQRQLRLPVGLIIDPDLGVAASRGDMAALRVHSQSAHLIPALV